MVGFIFIKTESKKEVKTFRALKMLKEITELTPLFGEFDLLAKVEARDFNELSVIVLKKIRSIPGVVETRTLPGVKI
ncbi:MAG: Lrp/AsnC ligand binding domain-containing protein [Thermoplasmatota archaeon]